MDRKLVERGDVRLDEIEEYERLEEFPEIGRAHQPDTGPDGRPRVLVTMARA